MHKNNNSKEHMKLFITLALTCLATQPLLAMDSGPTNKPQQPWQTSWKQAICAPANAFTKLPDKLAMLDNSSPITDEMLLTHNPDWHYVQGFDQETKKTHSIKHPGISKG